MSLKEFFYWTTIILIRKQIFLCKDDFSTVNIMKLSSHDKILDCHKCVIKFNVDGHFSSHANEVVICSLQLSE